MAAETNVKSQSITTLSAVPPGLIQSGMGAKSYEYEVHDYVAVGATEIQSAGSYYRILRIPVNARMTGLFLHTSKALDSGTPTLALDVGIAFSDSTKDGTPTQYQGKIPTTALDGSLTTFAAYSSPNKMFGSIAAATLTNSAAYNSGNLLFNGLTSNFTMPKLMGKTLWEIFNFVDGRGYPLQPGGMFDIYVYATTGANTGASGGYIGMRAQFTL